MTYILFLVIFLKYRRFFRAWISLDGNEFEKLAEVDIVEFAILQDLVDVGLHASQHILVRDVREVLLRRTIPTACALALRLLLINILLRIEKRLQIPQRVVHLRLRHVSLDSVLAARDVAPVVNQQLARLILAAGVDAGVGAWGRERGLGFGGWRKGSGEGAV